MQINRAFIAARKFCDMENCIEQTRFSVSSPDRMRIGTGPDFQIQCILYGKWQTPDCVVRIAVNRALLSINWTKFRLSIFSFGLDEPYKEMFVMWLPFKSRLSRSLCIHSMPRNEIRQTQLCRLQYWCVVLKRYAI